MLTSALASVKHAAQVLELPPSPPSSVGFVNVTLLLAQDLTARSAQSVRPLLSHPLSMPIVCVQLSQELAGLRLQSSFPWSLVHLRCCHCCDDTILHGQPSSQAGLRGRNCRNYQCVCVHGSPCAVQIWCMSLLFALAYFTDYL